MTQVRTLGYVALGVADLDLAIDFYTRVVRLHVTERRGDVAFLTGGLEHHWLRLDMGMQPGHARVAYEVEDDAALADAQEGIERYGLTTSQGGDLTDDRVEHWLRFTDPGGVDVELFTGMVELPVAPPSTGVELSSLLHTVHRVDNFEETVSFYREVLDFEISDWIERSLVFLRCGDRYHHSLALARRGPDQVSFDHLCVQVASIDDVMRFRHNAVRHGVSLQRDLLRHGPSGSMSVYVFDPIHGHKVEFCTGHGQVDPDHRPRTLPAGVDSVDIWKVDLADPTGVDPAGPAWRPADAALRG